MKATIETFVRKLNNSDEYYRLTLAELNILITFIVNCSTSDELRTSLTKMHFKTLTFGFGANHFWAHQRMEDNSLIGDRLVFIDFTKK